MAVGGSVDVHVQQIISDEMEKWNVKTKDIPEDFDIDPSKAEEVKKSKRYYNCKAFGSFNFHDDPTGKGHTKKWKSARAWCTLDLKQQCIAHRFSQDCNYCEGKSYPWFNEDALKRMAEFAVNLYLKKIGRIEYEMKDQDDNIQIGPPHDEKRCDMCKQLGRSCWIRVKRHAFNNDVEEESRSDEDEEYYYDEDDYDDDYYDHGDDYYDPRDEDYDYGDDYLNYGDDYYPSDDDDDY